MDGNSNHEEIFNEILKEMDTISLSDWMGSIPDDTQIGSLSIPGTHNSGAYYKTVIPSVRCQKKSLAEQLIHGIRFLDLRIAISRSFAHASENDKKSPEMIYIVHDAFPVHMNPILGKVTFRKVLNQIYDFLDNHSTETVIISLKFEGITHKSINSQPSLAVDALVTEFLSDYLESNKDRWFLADYLPTLGQVRGKCVLLRRFDLKDNKPDCDSLTSKRLSELYKLPLYHESFNSFLQYKNTDIYFPLGIPGVWKDCSTFSNHLDSLYVQDFYNVGNHTKLKEKTESIMNMINFASSSFANCKLNSQSQPPLILNFCTASAFISNGYWPSNIHSKLYPRVKKHICEKLNSFEDRKKHSVSSGIIIGDFVDFNDWEFCKLVVFLNYKLV